jgi:glycerophosphoryl diester phosphodiesterase
VEFPFPATLPIAHRGAHDVEHPENSLAALERAIRLGAPAVEFDVWNRSDGSLVVSHEPGELPAPPVEPYLDLVAGSDVLLNLDWKGTGQEELVAGLLDDRGLVERTIVSSEEARALARLKRALPGVTTGLSVEVEGIPALPEAVDAVMLYHRVASPEVTGAIRAAGRGLFLWTVTDPTGFAALLRHGPDGIATDAIEEQLAAGL